MALTNCVQQCFDHVIQNINHARTLLNQNDDVNFLELRLERLESIETMLSSYLQHLIEESLEFVTTTAHLAQVQMLVSQYKIRLEQLSDSSVNLPNFLWYEQTGGKLIINNNNL